MAADDQDFVVLDANDIQDFNEDGVLPLSEDKLSEIQQWLAPTDYTAASSEFGKHRASHLAGTGAWICHTDQYHQWHDSDRGALWIKAIAGAGKSVVAASLTSKLATTENCPVLYFFFRHIISANQKPQSLVRDYLSQLLEYSPELQHGLYKIVNDRRSLDSMSFDELWKLLVSALARFPRVYCVADALDEMSDGNDFFLHHLLALAQKNPTAIKVLMTSRPVPRVEQVLRHPCILQIVLEPQLVHPDISVYVRHRVSNCHISDKIRSQIHDTMCARADGHFLYARLMMDELLEPSKNLLSREKELLSALSRLPTPMADMYTQMLRDHSQRSAVPQELQLMLLQWVTGAERPLRLLELSSMIDSTLSALEVSKETKSIVREGCGPLLEILEDETVCPIHHSFTEYLYDLDRQAISSETATFAVLDYREAQRAIAITCIRYLASGWHLYQQPSAEDDRSPDNRPSPSALKLKYPFLNYAANNWHNHVRKSGAKDAAMASELDAFLLRDPEILPAWLELTHERGPFSTSEHAELLKTWGVLHVAAARGLGNYVEYLIGNGHDIECADENQHTPLALAARNGHDEVVAILLKNGAQNDEADDHGLKPMHHAAKRNHHVVVKLLLDSGVDPHTRKTKENPGRRCGNAPCTVGETPVQYACQNGHLETVKAFVPYLNGDYLHRAVCWAIQSRHTTVAGKLLETPGINVNYVVENQTLLFLACSVQDIKLIRLILVMGADVHALSSYSKPSPGIYYESSCYDRKLNPLHGFASVSHADWDATLMNKGFEMLLDAGLDPNSFNPRGSTILHMIMRSDNRWSRQEARCGIETTLSLLFDRGLSANLLTKGGSNALHLASDISTAALDMLIARGVDINRVRKSDGKTPLMAALERTDLAVAQHLLDRGADANLADLAGNTPLHFLAKPLGHQLNLDMIKALIAAGADVNGRNKNGNTPLHVGEVNPESLNTFLESGFDLEAKNKKGQTLLFQLVSHWRVGEQHKTLINAGACPLTRDSQGATILHAILDDIGGQRATKLLPYFVEKGVDPLSIDNFGNTLWHVVARLGADYNQKEQLAIMNLLMKYGVSPIARNHAGQTPLHIAFSVNRSHYPYGPIEFLLEHTSADVNVADYDKIRPIHLASSSDPELTCRLLELGVDPTVVTVDGQTPLMIACRTRECNIVCILLDHYKGQNQLSLIDQVDNQGRSALHYACKSGIPEVVALLLDAGASANLEDNSQVTPLHMCAEYLEEQASWDKANKVDLWSQQRRPMKAGYVLLTDTSRPRSNALQSGPIRIRETIRLLVANGADTSFLCRIPDSSDYIRNQLMYPGWTGDPLSYSISKGCEAMVSELLIIQDRLLQTRLPHSEHSVVGTEEPSSEAKEDIDAVKKFWTRNLNRYDGRVRFLRMRHMSEIVAENIKPGQNNVWLIEQLLKEDDEPSVEEANRLGACFSEHDNTRDSPLFKMASGGFTDLVRRFGQHAARMNTAWTSEKAPLNMNSSHGQLKNILLTAITRDIPNLTMVRLLVSDFGLDPNEQFSCEYRSVTQSYVHLVARPSYWWHTRALEFFLENGANIEALNSDKETPLIAALRGQHASTYSPARVRAVEILLLHGANPNAVDENNLTCLNIASGQPSCVRLLLKYGANPSLGVRPFIFDAIKEQDLETVRIIVESGADVNVLAQAIPALKVNKRRKRERKGNKHLRGKDDPQMWSHMRGVDDLSECAYPIHVAASRYFVRTPEETEKATKIINLLLEAGANPFLIYKDGCSIIHVLAEQGGILEPFFHHASFDMESRDHRGRTLLLAACNARLGRFQTYDVTLLTLLLQRGVSLTATDNDGCNALHSLIPHSRLGSSEHSAFSSVSQLLLPILATEPDLRGRTPFHYAVSAFRFGLIDILLSHGADPLTPDPLDGSTALHHLAGSLAAYKDILLHEPRAIMTTDEVSKLSTELGSDPPSDENLSDEDLHQLVRNKLFTPEELAYDQLCSPRRHFASLLGRGLSIEARDHAGETPLFKLMTAGLEWNYQHRDSMLPALKVFEAAGANIKARNNIGESVLHKLATQPPRRNVYTASQDADADEDLQMSFRWLVERGVDVSWEDEANRTCLDVAAATGAQWVLDMYKRK